MFSSSNRRSYFSLLVPLGWGALSYCRISRFLNPFCQSVNLGGIPLGYKRIPDKLGYPDIDEDAANTVRAAFEAYLNEGCLSHAAKWLNDHSYSIKKHMEGGGRHKRVGHFTVVNLHNILQSKAYVGIKVYTQKGEQKEVRAVWDAIIDEVTFKRVNDKLAKNKSRMKPKSFYKLPYLLSGVNFCMTCGDHLPGKSATGKCGKSVITSTAGLQKEIQP